VLYPPASFRPASRRKPRRPLAHCGPAAGSESAEELKQGNFFGCGASVKPRTGHIAEPGNIVFRHACKLGLEGIVSKRKDSPYRSDRSPDWLKMKNPACAAVKREAEEDWGR
jgi:hypothetical protein